MRRGFSLLELVVSCALFTLLTGALFFAWIRGTRAWLVASQRADLTTHAQLVLRRLERSLQASASAGLAFQADILTYPSTFGLTSTGNNTNFASNTSTGDLNWSKYLVWYRASLPRELWMREVAVPGASSAYSQALPLPAADLGSGPQALASYATGGSKVCDNVDTFSTSQAGLLVTVALNLTLPGGRSGQFSSSTRLRN